MVKVISDWEHSCVGAGMANNIVDDTDTEPTKYKFLDGNDRKSFLREHSPHILYLWHLSHKYGILKTVQQQLDGHAVVDGTSATMLMALPKKGSIHQIQVILHIVRVESSRKTWSTLLIQLVALSALHDKAIKHNKLTLCTGVKRRWKILLIKLKVPALN